MKISFSIPAILFVVLALPLQAENAPGLPVYPKGFVGGAEFNTKDGKQAAGRASVVTAGTGGKTYVVTARHLLGPMGGFKTQTAAADVPAFVRSIKIEPYSGGGRTYQVTGLLVPATEVDPFKAGNPFNDLSVFEIKGGVASDQSVALVTTLPKVGDPVWVAGKVREGVPEGEILHSAKVTYTKEGEWLVAQFDNDQIVTSGASGAPVLNADGKVVGVYSGHLKKGGHMLAYIVPSTTILSVINQPPVSGGH